MTVKYWGKLLLNRNDGGTARADGALLLLGGRRKGESNLQLVPVVTTKTSSPTSFVCKVQLQFDKKSSRLKSTEWSTAVWLPIDRGVAMNLMDVRVTIVSDQGTVLVDSDPVHPEEAPDGILEVDPIS